MIDSRSSLVKGSRDDDVLDGACVPVVFWTKKQIYFSGNVKNKSGFVADRTKRDAQSSGGSTQTGGSKDEEYIAAQAVIAHAILLAARVTTS